MKQTNLEKYRCRECGRVFYISAAERRFLDLDFGCPYGCGENGVRIRVTEAKEAIAGRTDGIKDHLIVIDISEGDFESSMGRKMRDQEEFDDWAALVEEGLLNGHIDWNILYECACDAMPGDDDE